MEALLLGLAQEAKKQSVVFVLFGNLYDNASMQVIQEIRHFFSFQKVIVWEDMSSEEAIQEKFLEPIPYPCIIILLGMKVFMYEQFIRQQFEKWKEEFILQQYLQSKTTTFHSITCTLLKITVHLQYGSLYQQFFQFLFEDLKEMNPYLPTLNSQEELSQMLKTIIYPAEYLKQEDTIKKSLYQTKEVILLQAKEIYQRFEAREALYYQYELPITATMMEKLKPFFPSVALRSKQYQLQLSPKRRILLEKNDQMKFTEWKCEFWKSMELPNGGFLVKPYLHFYISTEALAQLLSLQYQITNIVDTIQWKWNYSQTIQLELRENNSQCMLRILTRESIPTQKALLQLCSQWFPMMVVFPLQSKL